jgi:hypothetical protein
VEDTLIRSGVRLGPFAQVYSNLLMYGDVSLPHFDGNEWTAVTFLNAEWKPSWAGEIIFYPDGLKNPGFAVQPAPGRTVIFDGRMLHRAGVPSKLAYGPRVVLVTRYQMQQKDAASRSARTQ